MLKRQITPSFEASIEKDFNFNSNDPSSDSTSNNEVSVPEDCDQAVPLQRQYS